LRQLNKRETIYHNCYTVFTFHKSLRFMYLIEFCAYLWRSSKFSNFYEGCLKKKSDSLCVNIIIFSLVTCDGELFSNDGLSPCLLGYQVWCSDQTMV